MLKKTWLLIFQIVSLLTPFTFGGPKTQTTECVLSLELLTSKASQEPLKSEKRLKMTSEDGLSSERHQFDLTGTDFKCEVAFSGTDNGTYVNCWNADMSIGVQSDRTSIKGKNEHKTPNILSISKGSSIRGKINFRCG